MNYIYFLENGIRTVKFLLRCGYISKHFIIKDTFEMLLKSLKNIIKYMN